MPIEKSLEKMTGLLAALSALIITLSVSHEYGYFTYMGSFFQTFVTATDYFTNAIMWMPLAIVTALGWQNWSFLWKDIPKIEKGNWKSWILPSIILGVPILAFIFLSEAIPYFYLGAAVYLWFLSFDRFAPKLNNESQLALEIRNLVKIGVPICAALFNVGYERAKTDLTSKSSSITYILKVKDTQDVTLRVPLRTFDKGILVNNPLSHRVDFLKWDQIETIEKLTDVGSRDPLSCRWMNVLCDWTHRAP